MRGGGGPFGGGEGGRGEVGASLIETTIDYTPYLGLPDEEENVSRFKNSKAIEVLDLESGTTTCYNSIREASRALSCRHSAIQYCINTPDSRPFKDRYVIIKNGLGLTRGVVNFLYTFGWFVRFSLYLWLVFSLSLAWLV